MIGSMGDEPQENIDHMHKVVVKLEDQLSHLLSIAREEFGGEDLGGYDRRMVDSFAQAVMQTAAGLKTIHAMVDQEFQTITEEDVMAAFEKRLGRKPGQHKVVIPQEPFTRGEVPLSELPDWDAPTYQPLMPGRHRAPE